MTNITNGKWFYYDPGGNDIKEKRLCAGWPNKRNITQTVKQTKPSATFRTTDAEEVPKCELNTGDEHRMSATTLISVHRTVRTLVS